MGRHDETRWGVLTGEFWTTVVIIGATLIAAAVADNFEGPRAWWIVGVVASAYIVSRGLAKSGTCIAAEHSETTTAEPTG